MPTPTKLWSVNALADEFRLDRRTVTRRLRGVRPCGRLKGHPAWTLPVAARALLDDGEPHPPGLAAGRPTPLPPAWRLLGRLDHPRDRGFAAAALTVAYELQRLAFVAAVNEGVPLDAAFRISNVVTVVMSEILGERARRCSVEPWASAADPDLYVEEGFVRGNWPSVAAKAGRPGWQPPCYGGAWVAFSAEERERLVARGAGEDVSGYDEDLGEASCVTNAPYASGEYRGGIGRRR
jgi:hypothetical protein